MVDGAIAPHADSTMGDAPWSEPHAQFPWFTLGVVWPLKLPPAVNSHRSTPAPTARGWMSKRKVTASLTQRASKPRILFARAI